MKFPSYRYVTACVIVALFFQISAFSQKESANWYFGDLAGLDFNSGSPVPLMDGQLVTREGCATISDPQGNLLFYTDGSIVWDRTHQIMQNGTGLLGHSSSTMSALIIPKPGNRDSYYIFTIDKPSYYLTAGEPIDGVNYSEVDMTLNNGLGGIVASNKNVHLVTYNQNDSVENEYKSSEKITAVTHSDGSTIWVLTQFINKFYAFRVDANGVNKTPVISTVPQSVFPRIDNLGVNISAIGYMKLSPDGKKLAIAHSSTSLGSPKSGTKRSGTVLLYDFNNSTGKVSNQQTLISDTYPYGLEFSPNSKLLYATISNFTETDIFIDSNLYQYNLESSNITGSKYDVKTSLNVAGALQLAIDGKIYRAGYEVFQKGGKKLSVINKPNVIGAGSNYSHNTVNLGNYRTAELGLPPFVQSIFKYTFDYKFTCLGDETHFMITSEDPYDTVVWDFGDGKTSTSEAPLHTYANPGTYTVRLSLTLNGITNDPLIKQITISDAPKVMTTPYELTQCDSFDTDSTDGKTTFNLDLANSPLTFNTPDKIKVYYYHSLTEALDDTINSKALNPIYTNTKQDEILHAKVFKAHTDCYSMATIKLKTTRAIDFKVFQLEGCDPNNTGKGTFDLNSARTDIINTLNLPTHVTVNFYENEADAAIGVNPVSDYFMSADTTLFIRAESNYVCYGNGLLELSVQAFPTLQDQTILVCQSDFPIRIDSGLIATQAVHYAYLWSTGDATNSILVDKPGTYQLNVKDPVLYCEDTISITVVQNEIASIKNVTVNDYDVTINLNQPIDGFEFSMDDEFGTYQTSNVFLNNPPGTHTVYVRDNNQCNTISKEIYVIGFPKFLTPNNDQNHDYWNIKGLDPALASNNKIFIYNRFGKLIFTFNPLQSKGWDGKYNGQLLVPDDYWYSYKLSEDNIYTGHFSLKL
ncbi:T9SS type B sorting domain-containing protein [uncultured Gelidibacter sp.]|uniref:T9SS type B sorting domain-containing protein n=1 Tax=uncultured Gelidibacter sp. TaxID=259318 RepID=UPI00262DC7FA|nr:T9SS type B sorting domain-containing protein [uncultured Gelidibacter sp.]